jgi:hypothetical protein
MYLGQQDCVAAHPALEPGGQGMKVGRSELWAGRAFLAGLMMFTILPFISIFMTALHPLVATHLDLRLILLGLSFLHHRPLIIVMSGGQRTRASSPCLAGASGGAPRHRLAQLLALFARGWAAL